MDCFHHHFLSLKVYEYPWANNTWSDEICGESIEMIMPISGGLDACKEKCSANENCTTIEYALNAPDVDCCVLRKCPLPVPVPDVAQARWHGGKYHYEGYVKGKYKVILLFYINCNNMM